MSTKTRSIGRLALAAAGALALVLTGCASGGGGEEEASDLPFETVKDGTLSVAVYGTSPPIIIQENHEISGLIGDVVNGFAEANGLKVELFETDFAASLAATQQGRTDLTTFIYHNEERAKTVYYTGPLFKLPASVITHDDFEWNGVESLEGKKISAVIGQVWGPFFQEAFGDNVMLFQSDAEAATALVNGQVDAYVNSALQIFNKPIVDQDDMTYHLLEVGDLGMEDNAINLRGTNVVSCDNPALAEAFDAYLQEIYDSGELEEILVANDIPEDFWNDDFTPPAQGCGK